MKKTIINTKVKRLLADIYTPVGIYLRLRDRFRDTILLESTDHHAAENSYSFICINAIAGIEVKSMNELEFKMPAQAPEKQSLTAKENLSDLLWNFMGRFDMQADERGARFAQGLYGYFTFDMIPMLEKMLPQKKGVDEEIDIPPARYRLYQYVIAINHHKDELILCENCVANLESEIGIVEGLISSKDVPVYPFQLNGEETSNMNDEDYKMIVKKGMDACFRGDVFQIVLSRRYRQPFRGDEFNVYRTLRNINPSPYLFFFDYGDYRIMGSSPEAQLIIGGGKATVHPIAGTFKRTGDDLLDQQKAEELKNDPKENAEHVMLVDLARNDLSRVCENVTVNHYRQVQYYSHVIHLVSEVSGTVQEDSNPFKILFNTFPAGTLSGAPKYRALQLINELEPGSRSFYGGAIGFVGADGSCNHAIMIRSLLSRNNCLYLQAGAGVVAASQPEHELHEVNHKLNALKLAIRKAELLS